MRAVILSLFALVAFVGILHALPLDSASLNQEVVAEVVASDGAATVNREKRTVGVLRQLFPNFSLFVDRAIQMVTRLAFRVIGRLVLQGGGGGGGGGGAVEGGGEGRISITLPTYPPLPDEDEDEDTEEPSEAESDAAATTSNPSPADEENAVAESQVKPVRAKREAEAEAEAEEEEEEEADDLESEATGDNDNEVDEEGSDNDAESSDVDEEEDTEDPRNKRFLNFNLGASATAGAGAGAGAGSAGGSGNFIFDIVRLIAGGGNTQAGDEAANAPDGAAAAGRDEGNFGLGVPGPLTRLFVIANRGVANLIQDLILRLAQTSERIVNFKARLITSII